MLIILYLHSQGSLIRSYQRDKLRVIVERVLRYVNLGAMLIAEYLSFIWETVLLYFLNRVSTRHVFDKDRGFFLFTANILSFPIFVSTGLYKIFNS